MLFILAANVNSSLIGSSSLLVLFVGICHLSYSTWQMFLTMPQVFMNTHNIESISYIDFENIKISQQNHFSCLKADFCQY